MQTRALSQTTPHLQQTATNCNTLQHTATHAAMPYHKQLSNRRVLQRTHCITQQRTATRTPLQRTATHILQHTETTHSNTLEHAATHCNTLQHTTTHCNAMQHTAPHCTTLQHPATHCSTLQHTATRCKPICPTTNDSPQETTPKDILQQTNDSCHTLTSHVAHIYESCMTHTHTHSHTQTCTPYRVAKTHRMFYLVPKEPYN